MRTDAKQLNSKCLPKGPGVDTCNYQPQSMRISTQGQQAEIQEEPDGKKKTVSTRQTRALMITMMERFIETKTSPNTRRAYRSDIEAFLVDSQFDQLAFPDFCRQSFSVVTETIGKHLATVKQVEENTGRILNARTFNRKRNALSSFFGYLAVWHGYPRNPVLLYDLLSVPKKSSTEALSSKEIYHLIGVMEEQKNLSETKFRDCIIVQFLFFYALRRSEVAALRWEDIKPDQGKILVTQKGQDPIEKTLLPAHWKLLMVFRDRYEQDRKGPYVFHAIRPHRKTGKYHPIFTTYIFKMVAAVAARIVPDKKITPHSFRTSFVGEALDRGIGPRDIMNGTGHRSIDMISYYDRRDPVANSAIHAVGRMLD